MPFTLIHLSDLHIRSRRGKSNLYDEELSQSNEKAEALVSEISRRYHDAHVVITGDITDNGTSESVDAAKDLLKPWLRPERLSIVPGNHDCGTLGNIWIRGRKEYLLKSFSQCTPPRYPWLKCFGPVALIGLDSMEGTRGHQDELAAQLEQERLRQINWSERILKPALVRRAVISTVMRGWSRSGSHTKDITTAVSEAVAYGLMIAGGDAIAGVAASAARRVQLARGKVGQDQLRRLTELLSSSDVQSRIPVVLLHHHPWVPDDFKGMLTALEDKEELLAVLEGQTGGKRAQFVLFGHQHGSFDRLERGIRFVAAPSSVITMQDKLRFRILHIESAADPIWANVAWKN